MRRMQVKKAEPHCRGCDRLAELQQRPLGPIMPGSSLGAAILPLMPSAQPSSGVSHTLGRGPPLQAIQMALVQVLLPKIEAVHILLQGKCMQRVNSHSSCACYPRHVRDTASAQRLDAAGATLQPGCTSTCNPRTNLSWS